MSAESSHARSSPAKDEQACAGAEGSTWTLILCQWQCGACGSWSRAAFLRGLACRVWDIDSLDCVRVLEGHNEAVLALAVGPSFLVSGSYDTTVRFWALDSLRCVRCAPASSAHHPRLLLEVPGYV